MFRRHRCLTALSATSILAAGCMGGQSGDDGDFTDVGGQEPPTQAPLPEGCGEQDIRPVEADEQTVYGETPTELLAGVPQPTVPFHWVDYSSPNLTATHTPGVGTSKLDLALSLRTAASELAADEGIVETVAKAPSDDPVCPPQSVSVPVWVEATTEDGALNARVKGRLVFYGRRVAILDARFGPGESSGTLRVDAPVSKDPSTRWTLAGFNLWASLWPGGSSGTFSPEFQPTSDGASGSSAVVTGGVSTSPPPLPEPDDNDDIYVPEEWQAIGVWPRLEQCSPGTVVAPDEAVIGRSILDVLGEVEAQSRFPLTVRSNATSLALESLDVELTTLAPTGLVCARVSPQSGTLEFTVAGHLAASGAQAAPVLDADLRLRLRGHVDTVSADAVITGVHFGRQLQDAASPLERQRFQTETGLALMGIADEYTQVWWTWFGTVPKAGSSLQPNATFLITSPNAQQTAEVQLQIAEGAPGFSAVIDDSGGQQLPGDTLFEATLETAP